MPNAFLLFLRAHWHPLLLFLSAAVVASLSVQTCRVVEHQQADRQSAAIMAHQAAGAISDTKARRAADSARFFLLGQQYQLQHQLDTNARHAKKYPAVVLPAQPPREP